MRPPDGVKIKLRSSARPGFVEAVVEIDRSLSAAQVVELVTRWRTPWRLSDPNPFPKFHLFRWRKP